MRRLLWAVPTRGRPERLGVLLSRGLELAAAETDFAIGIDHDDPAGPAYLQVAEALAAGPRVKWLFRERDTLTGWTNKLVGTFEGQYEYYGSIGDDHEPETQGYDADLAGALDRIGGGIAYPNDMHQGAWLPTCAVVSAAIVEALGWLCYPGCRHYFVDDVWKHLGGLAGCLAYLDGVHVRHRHAVFGEAANDRTYAESMPYWAADQAAFERWLQGQVDEAGMVISGSDVDKARKAVGRERG